MIWATIMFIIFWDFLMVEQMFHHHKWNEALLLVIKWYVLFDLRVAKRLKTWDPKKLGYIRKMSKPHRIIAQRLVPRRKSKIRQHCKKSSQKRKLNLCRSTLFYMKIRVCLKKFLSNFAVVTDFGSIINFLCFCSFCFLI